MSAAIVQVTVETRDKHEAHIGRTLGAHGPHREKAMSEGIAVHAGYSHIGEDHGDSGFLFHDIERLVP